MKRLKSSDDIASYGDKGVGKDWVKRDEDPSLHRSMSHRNMYHKSDNGKKGLSSSSSRYDRLEDDREHSRSLRKRPDYDMDSYDRRKGYDRYRDGERGIISSSPRGGYGGERIHRSESFSVPRREFPKGFRSERDRSRRDGSVSSWRRFGGAKDVDECGSRSGFEYSRGNKVPLDETRRVRSPGGSLGEMGRSSSYHSGRTPDRPHLKDVKSPPCSKSSKSPSKSKDSETEQSKSVEVKKSEELPNESGNNSEMEEGELEPDPEPVPVVFNHVAEDEPSDKLKPNDEQFSINRRAEDKSLGNVALLSEAKLQLNRVKVHEEKNDIRVSDAMQNVVESVDNMSSFSNTLICETNNEKDAYATIKVVEFTKNEPCAQENGVDPMMESCPHNDEQKDKGTDPIMESCPHSDEQKDKGTDPMMESCPHDGEKKDKGTDPMMESYPRNDEQNDKGTDLVIKSENVDLPGQVQEVGDKDVTSSVVLSLLDDRVNLSLKDKGKGLALSPPNVTVSADYSLSGEAENHTEVPSTRGFQLFFADTVKKVNKADQSNNKLKDEKITIEPLELSLGLPNVLLPTNSQNVIHASSSQNTDQAPNSPTHTRSIQSFASSFRTSSDAFTRSMSFSGSQTFTHNPSCSLTNSSYDNCEQSVGSRPIFGPDQATPTTWQGQSLNETEIKESPMHQRILSNGNGRFHHLQTSHGILNGQVVRLQQHRVEEGSSKLPVALDRQFSLNKQLAGVQLRHSTDVRSPSQSIVSHGSGSDYYNDKNRVMGDKIVGDIHSSHKQEQKEQKESFQIVGADSTEPIINMIISDPIHVTAPKFNDMTRQAASSLKESVRDVILNPGKRSKLRSYQKALERRSDITLEILLKSHRAQLEVLVALKTGLQDFLQLNYEISSSDLAEIFLNLRCRNLTCRSLLPVDECDCRICVQKNGFCSACMCLVCSKFDTASNTCSWVGCDVCLHWCHADCGLRESYIRNGHSVTRAQGTTEMQFHCLACQHPSEMFGFVKEVFQNFAKEWTVETLSKELEYVRKIFRASEDARGKRLHEIATQMLTRLAARCDIREIQSCIMASFTNNDSFSGSSPVVPEKVAFKKRPGEGTSIIAGSSQEAPLLKAVYSDKAPQLEKSASLLPSFDFERHDKHIASSDMLRHVQKDPGFDELESIIRIKQAEANMFQSRSDDARREAEGLKRIANAKNEKIEEEYTSRIRKLHLIEAEKIRRQKFEELQTLEREHEEYFNMKTRMKSEIKDLLLKMEATKCNFTL